MTTAREKVRVAHPLKALPGISGAFATGELSYSKVRSLTRVAHRDNEGDLLAFGLRHTTAHVAQRCRELRCGSEASITEAANAYANRSLRVRRDHHRNTMTLTVDLPLDIGELVEKALDRARDDEVLDIPDLADAPWSTRLADAFVNKDFQDRWYFQRPDGIAVPDCGYVSRPYDNPPRGGLLSVAEKMVKEPPPPLYLH